MTVRIEYANVPIVYQMQHVGVTAYVRHFADWYFSTSLFHISVIKRRDGDRFTAELQSVSRAVWALQRVVYLLAAPILFVAKIACTRETSHSFIIEEKIIDGNGRLIGKDEASGCYSRGRYNDQGRLIRGKIYDASGKCIRDGRFAYKDNGEVWHIPRGQENAVMIERRVGKSIYRGTFNDHRDLLRGELVLKDGSVCKGEFTTGDGYTYLTCGVKKSANGMVEAGRFGLTDQKTIDLIEGAVYNAQGKAFKCSGYPMVGAYEGDEGVVIDGFRYDIFTHVTIVNQEELLGAEHGVVPAVETEEGTSLFKTTVEDFGYQMYSETSIEFAKEVFVDDQEIPDPTTDIGNLKHRLMSHIWRQKYGIVGPNGNEAQYLNDWEEIMTRHLRLQNKTLAAGG